MIVFVMWGGMIIVMSVLMRGVAMKYYDNGYEYGYNVGESKDNLFPYKRFEKITRLEIINHANSGKQIVGRVLTFKKSYGDFDKMSLEYQDEGKTLKIFLK